VYYDALRRKIEEEAPPTSRAGRQKNVRRADHDRDIVNFDGRCSPPKCVRRQPDTGPEAQTIVRTAPLACSVTPCAEGRPDRGRRASSSRVMMRLKPA
jgi:hypothetical protein